MPTRICPGIRVQMHMSLSTLKKCSSGRTSFFRVQKYLLSVASSQRSSGLLNPGMVALLSVCKGKACFSLVKRHWTQATSRKDMTLPCHCDEQIPISELLPTAC